MPGIGIDPGHYDQAAVTADSAAAFRAGAGIPADVPLIVMIAELTPAKRPLDAIRALAAMSRRDVHLAFLGVGRMEPHIRARATDLGLADRVHLCGFVEDVRPALASATASLLTSEREGLPRGLMESLSMGIPVVSTDARGCAEVVGDAGFVVPVGDVGAIAAALDRLDRTTPAWARMSALGRSRTAERYGLDGLISRHDALYAGLLLRKARAVAGVGAAG
jgi:glycosyltransferase involved in cell wall biosynthesis